MMLTESVRRVQAYAVGLLTNSGQYTVDYLPYSVYQSINLVESTYLLIFLK